jgi:PilZ domain
MSEAFSGPDDQLLVTVAPGKQRKERRINRRFTCEAPASLRLIKSGITLKGNIRDLSLTGCSIELNQRFPVGLNARMEILFSLHGLPLLLDGVSRCIHSPKLVGIEFGEVSLRKKAAIGEVIDELNEKLAMEEAAKAADTEEDPEASEPVTE